MVLNFSFTKFFLYLTKVLVQDGVQIKQEASVKIHGFRTNSRDSVESEHI